MYVGAVFSPDVCYRKLVLKDTISQIPRIIFDYRNENEVIKFGYTAGINFGMNFNKHFGLELGVHHSSKGWQQISTFSTFSFIINDLYLDLPLKANFTFGKKQIKFLVSTGAAVNIFLKETQTTVDNSTGERRTNPSIYKNEKYNISPFIGLGIDKTIHDKIHVKIEPIFRYGVLQIVKDKPITGYLYNVGCNIGMYFALN